MNNTSSYIYLGLEWITRFAYLNLLWVLFSLLGGVLFGFYPATTSMFAICREWLKGNTDLPLFNSFWEFYKKDFLKSNFLGFFVSVILLFIALDIFYIQASPNEQVDWTYIPLFAFMLIFTFFLFYLFPAFVHYDIKVPSVIKNAFLLMLVNPPATAVIVLCLVPLFFIMRLFPALAFIFGGSLYAFLTTWMAMHAIGKTHKKASHPEESLP
ncbi:YesL family protein [Planococcus sp. SE5232]|uniref:YesL family protein n=1 Tax=unclassified Planococcus (in: firmicutes) TaxID=2662419 RepID=UPI001CBFFA0F|nr:DUF624 domain-containing protein [Planococcus sp. 4-30]